MFRIRLASSRSAYSRLPRVLHQYRGYCPPSPQRAPAKASVKSTIEDTHFRSESSARSAPDTSRHPNNAQHLAQTSLAVDPRQDTPTSALDEVEVQHLPARSLIAEIEKAPKEKKPRKPRRSPEELEAHRRLQKEAREARVEAREDAIRKRKKARQPKQQPKKNVQSIETPPQDPEKYLRWAFAKSDGPGRRADKKRINITSELLTDDVLERLKPSLEKHVGCDIVDINPGVAVWSTKLHQFLKPRNHILLEPDDKLYNQFLKPLLDAPDSKYTLIPKSGIVWRQLEEVLTENNLPFQKAYEPNDPQLEEPNNTLLVVANLGFHPRKPYRGFESIASLVLHQLLDSVRSHSLFQRYGLVRMLIWVGDGEQTKVLPKTINQRRKSCVEAEITCGSIREIASSTHFSQKNCIAELAGIDEILKKMELRGITTPSNRASDTLRELKKPEGTGSKNVKFSKEFLAKLADLEERFRTGKIKKNLDDSHLVNTDTQSGIRLLSTPEYALLCNYRRQRKSGQSIPNKTQALVDEYILITGLQRAWFLARSQTEKDTLMESITVRRQALHDELESHDPAKIKIVTGLVDSSQASQIDPPLLLWESRDNEPLKVHPSEFYPAQEMALLDLQPKALWSILRKDYPNNYETFHFLLGQLMVAPRQPLKRGLEALAPGAFEWLIERCPLLTDPTRGGTLDTNDFRVRNLTTDMLRQMIEAWVDWPFKPSRYELIARAGSSVFDPDSLDDGLGGGGTI